MSAYDRWLEKDYQDACEESEAYEALVDQLMLKNQFDYEHVFDGIGFLPKEKQIELAKALKSADFATVGQIIYENNYKYALEISESEAQRREG